jgi:tetratricopeptide (TPR) repeat protein
VKPKALLFLVALGAAMFVVTFFVTRAFRAEQGQLAQQWSERGDAALAASQPAVAATAFRTALLYARDNEDFQFKLAKALADSGKIEEAEAYFDNLWDSEPGEAVINLELARLAVRKQDYANAVRFFHGAIYGVWPDEPERHRNQARLELIHFLLDRGATAQADAELIALEAELPNTAAAHKNVADLLMEVQDYPRALDEYRRATALDPADAAALASAGRAAFQLAQYTLAREYLRKAMASGASDQAVTNLAGIVDAMFALDPYAPRLTNQERRNRVIRAFEQAGVRLQQCATTAGQPLAAGQTATAKNSRTAGQAAAHIPPAGAPAAPMTEAKKEEWQQLRAHMNERALRRDPDLMDTAMNLVFRIERQSGPQCGPPAAADTALVLILASEKGAKR